MKRVAQSIGVMLSVGIALLFIPTIILLLAACLGLALILFLVCFCTGVPIQVKKDGQVIGEIIYFEFHPKEAKDDRD